jgi:hypothetical protein
MPVVLALHDARRTTTSPTQHSVWMYQASAVASDQLLHVQQAQGPTSGWSLIVTLLASAIVSSAWSSGGTSQPLGPLPTAIGQIRGSVRRR